MSWNYRAYLLHFVKTVSSHNNIMVHLKCIFLCQWFHPPPPCLPKSDQLQFSLSVFCHVRRLRAPSILSKKTKKQKERKFRMELLGKCGTRLEVVLKFRKFQLVSLAKWKRPRFRELSFRESDSSEIMLSVFFANIFKPDILRRHPADSTWFTNSPYPQGNLKLKAWMKDRLD